jgi:hypothetical protein
VGFSNLSNKTPAHDQQRSTPTADTAHENWAELEKLVAQGLLADFKPPQFESVDENASSPTSTRPMKSLRPTGPPHHLPLQQQTRMKSGWSYLRCKL